MRKKNTFKNSSSVYAAVLVGGKGKRLRPLSKVSRPKAFLSVTRNKKTMFRNTLDRIEAIFVRDNLLVVANKAHKDLVSRDASYLDRRNILLEPVSRNTAPAVAMAALSAYRRDPNAIMAVLPTDHYVSDARRQKKAILTGINFVKEKRDSMVLIGIRPDRVSDQFGYIKIGRRVSSVYPDIYKADAFKEKPDKIRAALYVESGDYLWNAGIFIFSPRTMLESLEAYAPAIMEGLSGGFSRENYGRIPSISLDHAVMEKARNVYCLKADYEWSDIGNFDELRKVLKKENRCFIDRGGKVIKII